MTHSITISETHGIKISDKYFLLISVLIFFIFFTYPAFSHENLNENIQAEKTDFFSDKKLNIEFGLSGLMLQGKAVYLLNDKVNPFVRLAFGMGAGSRNAQYPLFSVNFDIEGGILNNFLSTKNIEKSSVNNSYFKIFGGTTFALLPFAGVGIGYSSINKSLGFSLGLDIGSTFEYFHGSGLSGIIFLRPEINIGFVF